MSFNAANEVALSKASGSRWQFKQTSMVTQMDFYGISGGFRWTSTASLVDSGGLLRHLCGLSELNVISGVCFSDSGGRLRHLRWNTTASQVDFYRISSGLLRHLKCSSTASQGGFHSDQKKTSGTSGGVQRHREWTFLAIQRLRRLGISSGVLRHLKWTSLATQMDFYGISSLVLRYLKLSSIATQLDICGISVGVLRHLKLSSAASQVDSVTSQVQFYFDSGGFMWHLKRTPEVFKVDCFGISGERLQHLTQSSFSTRGTFVASQVVIFADSYRLLWHLWWSEMAFYEISDALLQHA
uniref:Uncharacterized protein n=1 Tax=Ditylenchus dipsaci TaxID=166011 RepID=A0A915DIG7_9BILA